MQSFDKARMPCVYEAGRRMKHVQGRVAISLPLTFETLCLLEAIRGRIRDLMFVPHSSGENSSLQSGAVEQLKCWGIKHRVEATDETIRELLQWKPNVLVDTCFRVGNLGRIEGILDPTTVVIEETGSGVSLIKRVGMPNPHIFLDESTYKSTYENGKGIGESVIAALDYLQVQWRGENVGIIGAGQVGLGLAKAFRIKGLTPLLCDIEKDVIPAFSPQKHQ